MLCAVFAGVELRQQLGDAVDEGLGADRAGIGMGPRQRMQMFAGAEADLEPDLVDGRREK